MVRRVLGSKSSEGFEKGFGGFWAQRVFGKSREGFEEIKSSGFFGKSREGFEKIKSEL